MAIAAAWLVSPRYDLTWIIGGGVASLVVGLLCCWHPPLLLPLFWAWLVLLDGSHLWATYSRTYADPAFWRDQLPLALGSLWVFAPPVVAVVLTWFSDSPRPVELFLLLAQLWVYHHIVRQHDGVVSLYDRKAGISATQHQWQAWSLRVALWALYALFVVGHPLNRAVIGLAPFQADAWSDRLLLLVPVLAVLASLAAVLVVLVQRRRAGVTTSLPAAMLIALCVAVHGLAYTVIAHLGPQLPGAQTSLQQFLLVVMVLCVFHNVQYHGIVWRFLDRRLGADHPASGLTGWLSRGFGRYAILGGLFGVGYVALAGATTRYPNLDGSIPAPHLVPVAFCLLWGVLFHHYYLDQRIWRPSISPAVRRALVEP